jgi:hypothetical protein
MAPIAGRGQEERASFGKDDAPDLSYGRTPQLGERAEVLS